MDEGLDDVNAVVAVVDVAGAARSMPPVRSSIVILLVPDDRPATMTPDGQFTDGIHGNDECDDESFLSPPPLCNAPGVAYTRAKIEGGEGNWVNENRRIEKKFQTTHETNVKKVKFTLKFVASWKCKWSNGREKLTGPRVQRRESSLHP